MLEMPFCVCPVPDIQVVCATTQLLSFIDFNLMNLFELFYPSSER